MLYQVKLRGFFYNAAATNENVMFHHNIFLEKLSFLHRRKNILYIYIQTHLNAINRTQIL